MISTETLRKAHLEITRLNRELHALHLEEERCKLKRSRLESDKARVQSLVDLCELAQILNMPAVGERFTIPGGKDGKEVTFRIEDYHGAKLIVADKPVAAKPAVSKPQGIPTVPDMILRTLTSAGDGLRPAQITNSIRREWWPDMPADRVATTIFRMAHDGRLAKDGNRYKLLNGHGDE